MSDNNNNNSANQNGSSKKRKSDGTGPSPRGKKLTNDLLATLENPDLCDVTLVGSDGGRVPAIRVYLSARSDVLQHLLVGQFKEASEEEVHMDYPAAVLKALVHFCCTDTIPDVNTLGDDAVTSMRMAVKLAEALRPHTAQAKNDNRTNCFDERRGQGRKGKMGAHLLCRF